VGTISRKKTTLVIKELGKRMFRRIVIFFFYFIYARLLLQLAIMTRSVQQLKKNELSLITIFFIETLERKPLLLDTNSVIVNDQKPIFFLDRVVKS